MNDNVADVLIIGGGPAGCSAAITLARANAHVIVCEAGTYPHAKVCGEFLSPECVGLLKNLGLPELLAACGAQPLRTVQLTAPNGATWATPLPAMAWGLSRSALDHQLAQQAVKHGVDLREATTVTSVQGNLAQGFEIETRTAQGKQAMFTARAVISAYGKRSALDRVWKRDFFRFPSQPFVALKAHFRGPSLGNSVQLHAFPGGYCGLAEIEQGLANVSLLVEARTFQTVIQNSASPIDTFISWMRAQNPYLDAWLSKAKQIDARYYTLGQVSFGAKHLVVDDVLMVGDAAGLMAPLAGDGISMALESGALAGKLCSEYLAGQHTAQQLRAGYEAAWKRQFSKRITLARLLQSAMLHPRLFALALNLFNVVPQLGQQFILNTRAPRLAEVT